MGATACTTPTRVEVAIIPELPVVSCACFQSRGNVEAKGQPSTTSTHVRTFVVTRSAGLLAGCLGRDPRRRSGGREGARGHRAQARDACAPAAETAALR